ncbi:hypothetical protein TcWFU_003468 [Taenia crassiceps]|uniref:Uncharacterized protein n=1 Tax=Taenia crassiceps TaxID=6207 RepID=A0ABR4QBK1_9CEST
MVFLNTMVERIVAFKSLQHAPNFLILLCIDVCRPSYVILHPVKPLRETICRALPMAQHNLIALQRYPRRTSE